MSIACSLICFGVWQVAIPVVPTVRVVITFTKFVELQPVEQFFTPFSSPRHLLNAGKDEQKKPETHNSSFISLSSSSSSSSSSVASAWLRRNNSQNKQQQRSSSVALDSDPFAIPPGYTWTSVDDKSRKMKKSKSVRKSK